MPKNKNERIRIADSWLVELACVGPVGKSPYAPGTAGSFAAIVLAPYIFMPLPLLGRFCVLAFLFWIGTHACTKAEEVLHREDPAEVVIDEVFGQWITCLPFAAFSFWEYLLAFFLFRLFDITKIWPIKRFEAYPAGLGIMLDDAMAGVYAFLSLFFLRFIYL